ncbi:MAG: NUDIX domain-containing protein, partial [Dehalococcoidia bacterium]
QVLLQLRDDRPDLHGGGLWATIGGEVEPGETPERAARRETLEECGLAPARLVAAGHTRRTRGRDGVVRNIWLFGAAVDWSLDDIILGEGQALAWWTPDEVAALPLYAVVRPDIVGFARSAHVPRLAAEAAPARDAVMVPLPADAVTALGVRPGHLVALAGLSAGFAARLRAALPPGARLTSSPGPGERPDVVLCAGPGPASAGLHAGTSASGGPLVWEMWPAGARRPNAGQAGDISVPLHDQIAVRAMRRG